MIMAEFIELHKKSLVDEKTFAVLQNVNNISEICETPRAETYEQIKQLLSECGSIATADVAPVVHGQWNIMDGAKTRRICSKCRWDVPEYGKFLSYCPNCGAKMDGGESDNG